MATKKKKVGFSLTEPVETDDNTNKDGSRFSHTHQKTAHALEHAKMVEKGRKFWEEKEEYEHISEVAWWQLKAAKDFETGVGQKFYRHGTLSTWTDEQIATLQKDMQTTLAMAGYDNLDAKTKHIRMKTLEQKVLPSQPVQPSEIVDFAAEIKRQQKQQNNNKEEEEEEQEKDPLYDFDDEIIHTGHSDEEDDDGKQSQYDGDSMNLADATKFKQLDSINDLGTFDAKQLGSHRRTRTEALRVKLQNMQKELETMSSQSEQQNEKLENVQKNQQERDHELQSKLNGLTGALQSANDELDRAEEQISEKDEEISNLKRQLALSKSMNQEMRETVLDTESGLTADDLLKQRMKDANRFAFMLGAMQEQLDFERTQFVKKIHSLELQLEHKDVQLNALFQLYNNIVTQTRESSKSWWERFTTTK